MKNVIALLEEEGIALTDARHRQFDRFMELVVEWNAFAGLVSNHDEVELATVHLPDCLSLAPMVKRLWDGRSAHLDIGSGGGFPAIPIKIVVPELPMLLIERNAKKVGFLRKVTGALGLAGVSILHGEFPATGPSVVPSTITARAVEKPLGLCKPIFSLVAQGAQFLCQSRLDCAIPRERFDFEPVDDLWKTQGLRRGDLWIVRRRAGQGG